MLNITCNWLISPFVKIAHSSQKVSCVNKTKTGLRSYCKAKHMLYVNVFQMVPKATAYGETLYASIIITFSICNPAE